MPPSVSVSAMTQLESFGLHVCKCTEIQSYINIEGRRGVERLVYPSVVLCPKCFAVGLYAPLKESGGRCDVSHPKRTFGCIPKGVPPMVKLQLTNSSSRRPSSMMPSMMWSMMRSMMPAWSLQFPYPWASNRNELSSSCKPRGIRYSK